MGTVRPGPGRLLVEPIASSSQSAGGIHLPATSVDIEKARVIALPPHGVRSAKGMDISIGSIVYIPKGLMQQLDPISTSYVIDIGTVLAVELAESATSENRVPSTQFFEIPEWKEYQTNDFSRVWQQWENIRNFNMRIHFLEPFQSLHEVAKRIYDSAVTAIGPKVDHGGLFEFARMDLPRGQKQQYVIACKDDYWGAIITLTELGVLEFKRESATIRNLVEIVPRWMDALHHIVSSPEFVEVAGPAYTRVSHISINVHQIVRLEGKGSFEDPVRNSESMGHFIKFGTVGSESISDTLATLGIDESTHISESLGRVDLLFSFDRKIADRPIRVFLKIEAPANDESRLLFLRWDFQDHHPGILPDRQYGSIMTEYLRDVVFRAFYKSWLKDYRCTTLLMANTD